MRKIFTFGETILDIIFEGHDPVAARPGGAMLNTAVSLGRAGLPVFLISEISHDIAGGWIIDFLKKNDVNTQFLQLYDEGKTPVSIASLDDKREATYNFYKSYPETRLTDLFPVIEKGDIVLFGSFYSITLSIRKMVKDFILRAKEAGAMIIYDPNIRKNHAQDVKELMPALEENLSFADIVRASRDDLLNIFETRIEEDWIERIGKFCRNLIITRGHNNVTLNYAGGKTEIQVNKIEPVSTIGAGDNFNAGLIYGLFKNNITKKDLERISPETWREIIETASEFAKNTCLSFDNYISMEFADRFHG
jgi:fructokinase